VAWTSWKRSSRESAGPSDDGFVRIPPRRAPLCKAPWFSFLLGFVEFIVGTGCLVEQTTRRGRFGCTGVDLLLHFEWAGRHSSYMEMSGAMELLFFFLFALLPLSRRRLCGDVARSGPPVLLFLVARILCI
jgi:hypothetical protein